MKYILGIITTLLIILSFTIKCDHRYTGIEAVKISAIPNAVLTIAHCGIQPGKRLICVKCHHEVDQQVDYGGPLTFGSDINSDTIQWSWNQKAVWESDYSPTDSLKRLRGFLGDTVRCTIRPTGCHFIKGDTLCWSK